MQTDNYMIMDYAAQTAGNLFATYGKYTDLARNARTNAASLARESLLYGEQAGMLMRSANAYSAGARYAKQVGEANARNERLKAAQLQQFTDARIQEAVKVTRAKMGQGRAAFASQGVLLEAREGAAVTMWEQDEAADNAYQQLLIMQEAENAGWEFRTAANMRLSDGYAAAAGLYGQAAGQAAAAYSARLKAEYAYAESLQAKRDARKAKRNRLKSTFGSLVGATAGAVGGFIIGGPVGAAAGASAGSSIGSGIMTI